MVRSYEKVIEEFADEIVSRPFDFVAEFDVQARLTERLRSHLQENDELFVDFSDNIDSKLVFLPNSSYKDQQWQFFIEKLDQQPPSRVYTEVVDPALDLGDGSDKSIDIVVFNQEIKHPIKWNNGSKRYNMADFDAAIELKYIKQKKYFPTTISRTELQNAVRNGDEDRIRRNLDWEENSIGPDLRELNQLRDTETYLFIFSNYDYLYTTDIEKEREKRPEYVKSGEIAKRELGGISDNTKVVYVNADHWTWID